jgi:hypothetical protein
MFFVTLSFIEYKFDILFSMPGLSNFFREDQILNIFTIKVFKLQLLNYSTYRVAKNTWMSSWLSPMKSLKFSKPLLRVLITFANFATYLTVEVSLHHDKKMKKF